MHSPVSKLRVRTHATRRMYHPNVRNGSGGGSGDNCNRHSLAKRYSSADSGDDGMEAQCIIGIGGIGEMFLQLTIFDIR